MVNIIRDFTHRIRRAVILSAAFFAPKNRRTSTHKKALYMGGSLVVLAGAGAYVSGLLRPAAATEPQASTVEVKVSSEAGNEPITTETPTSADTGVQLHINSSTQSSSHGAQQKSIVTQETSRTRRVINRQSADGSSSVHFEVDSGANAKVEMTEHGSNIEIRVEENTGM